MSEYGVAAVKAVELYIRGGTLPRQAWERVTIDIFGEGTSSQTKGCPRDAFLGLCEEGMIKDIPAGTYTHSQKNRKYAVDAVMILMQVPSLASHPAALWNKVIGDQEKAHNQQMSVVIALWSNSLIRR